MPNFEPTLDAPALAEALSLGEAEAEELHQLAIDTLEPAFHLAWRPVPESVANDAVVKVARALKEAKRASRAGKQLATVEGGTAVRAPLDPLDPIRSTLARYVVPL